MSTRILITGSRTWDTDDDGRITRGLQGAWDEVAGCAPGVVLVHGAAWGVDRIAAGIWTRWGQPVEPHPADWTGPCRSTCRPDHRRRNRAGSWYCPAAGMHRNTDMVALGADVCLAFIRNHSHGATRCADVAEAAGIPTRRIPWEETA